MEPMTTSDRYCSHGQLVAIRDSAMAYELEIEDGSALIHSNRSASIALTRSLLWRSRSVALDSRGGKGLLFLEWQSTSRPCCAGDEEPNRQAHTGGQNWSHGRDPGLLGCHLLSLRRWARVDVLGLARQASRGARQSGKGRRRPACVRSTMTSLLFVPHVLRCRRCSSLVLVAVCHAAGRSTEL